MNLQLSERYSNIRSNIKMVEVIKTNSNFRFTFENTGQFVCNLFFSWMKSLKCNHLKGCSHFKFFQEEN